MFKVIDGQFTSIFNKTKLVTNGLTITERQIKNTVNAFNSLNSKQNFGYNWNNFLQAVGNRNQNVATYFEQLAKQGASARASIEGVYSAMLNGNTRGIQNVRSVISVFNKLDSTNQRAFAQAVGQTNVQLGMYLGNLNGANASMKGYTSTLVGATAKTVALQIASMALNAAISFGISAAISGLISLIGNWINSQQEAIDKANEAATAVKTESDTIDEYANKIIELRGKLADENITQQESVDIRKELSDIQDEIIKKYSLEADGISLVTGNIQDQIFALYKLKKAKYKDEYGLNKEGYDAAKNSIQRTQALINGDRVLANGIGSSQNEDVKELRDYITSLFSKNGFTVNRATNAYGQDKGIDRFEIVSDMYTIDDALKQIYNDIDEYSKNGSEEVKKAADVAMTYISQVRRDWSNKTITDNEELYSQWLKYDSDYSGSYIELIRKQANLEYAIETKNAEEIAKARSEFYAEYAKATEEAVKNGDTDVAKYLEKTFGETTNGLEEIQNSTNNTTTSVTSLNDAFAKLKELLEDIIGYADTFQSAMQKISAGTGLTTDEVRKLLEIDPSLFDKFIRQEDGTWTIDLGTLKMSYQTEIVDNGKDKIAIEKANWQKEYDSAVADLERLQEERNKKANNITGQYAYQELNDLDKQIEDVYNKINEAQDNLNITSFEEALLNYSDYDRIRDAFEIVENEIDNYNSDISDLNNAIDSLNEGNSLSYDDMTKLVGIYPQLQDKVTETNNGYQISVDALEDVRKQSYTTRNDYIDDRIAETEALKDEVAKQIEEYRKLAIANMISANTHGNYFSTLDEYLASDENYQKILEQLQAYDDVISKLQGYKRTVIDNGDKSGSKTNSTTDILQQQIDYYKMLLEAVEIVTDKVIEGIEKEKEAIDSKIDKLNDEKDALKDKNDEQQRELDLIEAKNNLDKAKKQKVFVYEKGQGLVQVQDKKAIADAQKEYDDVQNEIKKAEIDKQIDALEKQNESLDKQIEGWNEYKDQFSNMENDVKDTLTVEQAKKALNTDEKGLLSLDEKTVNGIRDGLAEAVYKKDVEDNKDNEKYVTVDMDTYLKQLGATVSWAEFQNMANNLMSTTPTITPLSNNSTINNAQTVNNNKTINSTFQFNIYDASDPQKVANEVRGYMKQLLTETINSTKW